MTWLKQTSTTAAVIVAVALLAVACGSNGGTEAVTEVPNTATTEATSAADLEPPTTAAQAATTQPAAPDAAQASPDQPVSQLDLATLGSLRADSRQIQTNCLVGLGDEATALVDFEWIRELGDLTISELVAEVGNYVDELFDDLQFSVAAELVNYFDCVDRSYPPFSGELESGQVHANLVLCDILGFADPACLTFAESSEEITQ